MHLKTGLINRLASVAKTKQVSPLACRHLSSALSCKNQTVKLEYRPLYCVTNQTQIRWANTSSEAFAPSTLATSRTLNKSHLSGANASVFEDSDHLPALPVPELTSTLQKLKESISPVAMNSAELASALHLIDKFSSSAGPKLDLFLRHKAEQTKNWMTHDWWVREAYLKSRKPLTINSNPAMIYPNFPFEVNNQRALIRVTSQLISGIIDYKLALQQGFNPEATSADAEYRLNPDLCYSQYKNIFGSSRVPGEQVDQINTQSSSQSPFSIIISHKNRMFELQLENIDNEQERIDKIVNVLDRIFSSTSDHSDASHSNHQESLPSGILTTLPRSTWADAYKLLDSDSLSAINGSQFMVSIDSIAAPSLADQQSASSGGPLASSLLECRSDSRDYLEAIGRQILHSDTQNVGNRWFDKSFQLVVVADESSGRLLGAGINYEHSFCEATVISKLIEHSYDKTVQNNRDSANSSNFFAKQQIESQSPSVFRQLRMVDDTKLNQLSDYIVRAQQDYSYQLNQFDLSYLDYKQYGSNAVKSWRFSPDSWFQVALQSGFYNLHKRLGPCYESASTRRFAYGRTETIRSLTQEVADFCTNPSFESMKSAIQSHKSFSLSAVSGDAIDRVLMGYMLTFNELRANEWTWGVPRDVPPRRLGKSKQSQTVDAEDLFMEDYFSEKELSTMNAFFKNELIQRSYRFALSTSQVSSMHPNVFMCYGPMLADGYGCCYNITGQQMVAAISANSSNQSFSSEAHKLSENVRESLDMMRELVEDNRVKK